MIKVVIYKDNKNIVGYTVSGHANYSEYGQDIVCSAVSVLAQTVIISLLDVCGIDEKLLKYKIDDDGYLEVKLPKNIDEKIFEKSQTVLYTFDVGIRSIIEGYGEFVTLEYREV